MSAHYFEVYTLLPCDFSLDDLMAALNTGASTLDLDADAKNLWDNILLVVKSRNKSPNK